VRPATRSSAITAVLGGAEVGGLDPKRRPKNDTLLPQRSSSSAAGRRPLPEGHHLLAGRIIRPSLPGRRRERRAARRAAPGPVSQTGSVSVMSAPAGGGSSAHPRRLERSPSDRLPP
jgi:hypothetical protein